MPPKKTFYKKPLTRKQIERLKVQEEPAADLILEIMSETEFGTNQRSIDKILIHILEQAPGYYKNKGHFIPLKHYNSTLETLKNSGLRIRGIPPEVLKYFDEFVNNVDPICHPDVDLSPLPNKLLEKLKPFQRDGLCFGIQHNGRCLIADEMGLGKTLQAISIAVNYYDEWPLLVICPSSVRTNWQKEIRNNTDTYDHISVVMSSKDIEKPLGNVIIVSYEIASKHSKFISDKKFNVVIADECHYLKNSQSKRCRELLPILLNSNHTILLSGTALLSRPCELYPQLQALRFGIFPTFHLFGIRYCNARVTQFGWDYTGNSHLTELHILLSKYVMIRRLKQDVLHELPEKVRMSVTIPIADDVIQSLNELRCSAEINKTKSDFDKLAKQAQFMDLYNKTCSAKINGVCEFLDKMLTENKKLLVFGHHIDMLNGIEDFMKDHNVSYIRIDGATQPLLRSKYVDQFQNTKRIRIAILSITAAGSGITLHSADTVVFAELYWTPGILRQAEDRVHRIGQKNNVRIFYLIGKQTADDFIWPLLEKKLQVSGTTLDGKQSGHDCTKVNVNIEPIEEIKEISNNKNNICVVDIDSGDDTIEFENSSEMLEVDVFDVVPRRKTKTVITDVVEGKQLKKLSFESLEGSNDGTTNHKKIEDYFKGKSNSVCGCSDVLENDSLVKKTNTDTKSKVVVSKNKRNDCVINGKVVKPMRTETGEPLMLHPHKMKKNLCDFFTVKKEMSPSLKRFAEEVSRKKKKVDDEVSITEFSSSLIDSVPTAIMTPSSQNLNDNSKIFEDIKDSKNKMNDMEIETKAVNELQYNNTNDKQLFDLDLEITSEEVDCVENIDHEVSDISEETMCKILKGFEVGNEPNQTTQTKQLINTKKCNVISDVNKQQLQLSSEFISPNKQTKTQDNHSEMEVIEISDDSDDFERSISIPTFSNTSKKQFVQRQSNITYPPTTSLNTTKTIPLQRKHQTQTTHQTPPTNLTPQSPNLTPQTSNPTPSNTIPNQTETIDQTNTKKNTVTKKYYRANPQRYKEENKEENKEKKPKKNENKSKSIATYFSKTTEQNKLEKQQRLSKPQKRSVFFDFTKPLLTPLPRNYDHNAFKEDFDDITPNPFDYPRNSRRSSKDSHQSFKPLL
ncbi:Non-specific serine/threonine protein kinase [Entamoeba marina]